MSNPSHHQLPMVVVFAGGLLWAVSGLFGEGSGPGVLDRATNSVIARAKAAPGSADNGRKSPSELANIGAYSSSGQRPHFNPWSNDSDSAAMSSAQGDANADVSDEAPVLVDDEVQSPPPIEDVTIYK